MKECLFREIYDQLTIDAQSIACVQQAYSCIRPDTLDAIHRRKFQFETMKNIGRLQRFEKAEAVLNKCLESKSVKLIANQYGVSTCALARYIMKPLYAKDKISDYLKIATMIPHQELRTILTQEINPLLDWSHPNWDVARRQHGERMEAQLRSILTEHDVIFFEEKHLRSLGFPKTPDFKLACPIGLLGHSVCWIESKALFGDDWSHEEYCQSQYRPYCNRFGPGAVVYWHGFIDELQGSDRENGLVLLDQDTLVEALKTATKLI